MIKYIFFDVSGTLLYKPTIYQKIHDTLEKYGVPPPLNELKYKHKLLSEIIHFPDRTNKDFYNEFNTELLNLMGIYPETNLLDEIFETCSYLPWEKYNDTEILTSITLPMGIISNFNNSLKEKIHSFFGNIFTDIFVSEELGIAKPSIEFYIKACENIDLSPENILYIGDSFKLDIIPAHKIGMKTLLIDRDNFFVNSHYRINDLVEILEIIK